MPRSIAGIARKGDRFFIAKRVPGGALGGKWEFPGGKVERGESDQDALRREFQEEFAVDIEVGVLLAEATFEHAGDSFDLVAYAVNFDAERLSGREHTEWRWASLEQIPTFDFVESDLKLLEQLRRFFETSTGNSGKR